MKTMWALRKYALSNMYVCRHLLKESTKYSLLHLESSGIRMDINPYKIEGCETHFSNGLQLGPSRMYWIHKPIV